MQDSSDVAQQPTLLTIPQVAICLGVCRAHVYKLIDAGLPIVRLGRLVRINTRSLQRWLDDQEQSFSHLALIVSHRM